ncbi:unnamed protein product [Gordionus sp. m RMFG-2023]
MPLVQVNPALHHPSLLPNHHSLHLQHHHSQK